MRQAWVRIHRWAGLSLAGFLVLCGLTGSVLAYRDAIDRWLNPDLLVVQPRASRLDPLTLRAQVETQLPQARVDYVQLAAPRDATQAASFFVDARDAAQPLGFTEVYADPYTGRVLGTRGGDLWPVTRRNLLDGVFELHAHLAAGEFGRWLLGIVVLIWTLDCFLGAYLTFPRGRHDWLRRWKPAWLVKRGAPAVRVNFDLHRAGGLWPWALLLVFAWSSVGFNLDTVYSPVMNGLLGHRELRDDTRERPVPLDAPELDWSAAVQRGRVLMREQARVEGFDVEREWSLAYTPATGSYEYRARTSRDIDDDGARTRVVFDGDTGALLRWWAPTGVDRSGTVTRWLLSLHMAKVFGEPYRLLVCLLGLAVTLLSATGVLIWWRKRTSRRLHAAHAAANALLRRDGTSRPIAVTPAASRANRDA